MTTPKLIALALALTSIASLRLHAGEWTKHVIQPPVKGGIHGASASDFDRDGHTDVIT